jgi:uncharacterized protein with FMN-binding domain
VLFSVLGTILGLVALLTFKTHGHTALGATALPSAALPGTGTSAPALSTPSATGTGAPPDPSSGSTSTRPRTSSPTPTSQPPKSYDGSAVQTRYGVVQVQVAISGGKISNVSFLQLTADDPRSADINSQAGPLLLQETLSAQSANVNSISGATYTSEGYLESLQSALDQAGFK